MSRHLCISIALVVYAFSEVMQKLWQTPVPTLKKYTEKNVFIPLCAKNFFLHTDSDPSLTNGTQSHISDFEGFGVFFWGGVGRLML